MKQRTIENVVLIALAVAMIASLIRMALPLLPTQEIESPNIGCLEWAHIIQYREGAGEQGRITYCTSYGEIE